MKRIMNDVAVQTLLYTMSPQAIVNIVDVQEEILPADDPLTSWYGDFYTVDNILHDYRLVKIAKARIRRTLIRDNQLVIVIDTRHESY